MLCATTSLRSFALAFVVHVAVSMSACQDTPTGGPWCADRFTAVPITSASVTWSQHIAAIALAKCAGCHAAGGVAPFPLQSAQDFSKHAAASRTAIANRTMPPWQAHRCCSPYLDDFSLTNEEVAVMLRWFEDGTPVGPATAPTPVVAALGGVSRVDAVLKAPAYTPKPPAGKTDEVRCFVLDPPAGDRPFLTGFSPRPGARSIVHHLILAAIDGDDAAQVRKTEGVDGRPGVECAGGLGKVRSAVILGGGLQGGDFPRSIGRKLAADHKLLLNIHYSLASLPPGAPTPQDQTEIDLRLDTTAREAKGLVVANPAWLIGDAMFVGAGQKDAAFWFSYTPTLLTAGKTAFLQSVTPHLHALASRVALRIERKDGSSTCLLEIPRWQFGWERPYWLQTPIALDPADKLYIECHFDNSAENQGSGAPPADFAWGEGGQDMCAGFLTWTETP